MSRMTCYKLSDIAEQDISEIYDYTRTHHGYEQAVHYLTGLDPCFNSLIERPEIGRERPEIRDSLRSIIYKHHVVFYRLHADYIRIVRVLHESRDMPRFLQDV